MCGSRGKGTGVLGIEQPRRHNAYRNRIKANGMTNKTVQVNNIEIGDKNPIVFITGPCQLESRDHAMMMAEQLTKLFSDAGAQFIFKSSYDKANRSSISSARGIGMDEGLRILKRLQKPLVVL